MAHISIENQLKKILSNNNKVIFLKLDSGESIGDVLKSQAELLIDIIENEIERSVYSKPEGWYKRSGDLKNSINKNIFIDPKNNTITISFLEDKAWHDSWITKEKDSNYNHRAFIPLMVNEGFHTLDVSGDTWYKSSNWYEGTHFLENSMAEFKRVKKPWITIKLEKPDKWW